MRLLKTLTSSRIGSKANLLHSNYLVTTTTTTIVNKSSLHATLEVTCRVFFGVKWQRITTSIEMLESIFQQVISGFGKKNKTRFKKSLGV